MHNEWVPPKSTPTPPTPPSLLRQAAPSADEVRARLAEVEAEVERATVAMVRLWAWIVDLKSQSPFGSRPDPGPQ